MTFIAEIAAVQMASQQDHALSGRAVGIKITYAQDKHPLAGLLIHLMNGMSKYRDCYRLDIEHDPSDAGPKFRNGTSTISMSLEGVSILQLVVRYIRADGSHFFPANYVMSEEQFIAELNSGLVADPSRRPGVYGKVTGYAQTVGSDKIYSTKDIFGLPAAVSGMAAYAETQPASNLDFMVDLVEGEVNLFSMIQCKDGTRQVEIPIGGGGVNQDNPLETVPAMHLINFTFEDSRNGK